MRTLPRRQTLTSYIGRSVVPSLMARRQESASRCARAIAASLADANADSWTHPASPADASAEPRMLLYFRCDTQWLSPRLNHVSSRTLCLAGRRWRHLREQSHCVSPTCAGVTSVQSASSLCAMWALAGLRLISRAPSTLRHVSAVSSTLRQVGFIGVVSSRSILEPSS